MYQPRANKTEANGIHSSHDRFSVDSFSLIKIPKQSRKK